MKSLTDHESYGKITVKNGWIKCPICGDNRLKLIRPDEVADLVYIHCRRCKNDIPLTLKQGQSFKSQGQQDTL